MSKVKNAESIFFFSKEMLEAELNKFPTEDVSLALAKNHQNGMVFIYTLCSDDYSDTRERYPDAFMVGTSREDNESGSSKFFDTFELTEGDVLNIKHIIEDTQCSSSPLCSFRLNVLFSEKFETMKQERANV